MKLEFNNNTYDLEPFGYDKLIHINSCVEWYLVVLSLDTETLEHYHSLYDSRTLKRVNRSFKSYRQAVIYACLLDEFGWSKAEILSDLLDCYRPKD